MPNAFKSKYSYQIQDTSIILWTSFLTKFVKLTSINDNYTQLAAGKPLYYKNGKPQANSTYNHWWNN